MISRCRCCCCSRSLARRWRKAQQQLKRMRTVQRSQNPAGGKTVCLRYLPCTERDPAVPKEGGQKDLKTALLETHTRAHSSMCSSQSPRSSDHFHRGKAGCSLLGTALEAGGKEALRTGQILVQGTVCPHLLHAYIPPLRKMKRVGNAKRIVPSI